MKSSKKHQAITSQLATEILAGKYGETGRLPSEVQLVKRFGVARPTIGQALHGLQAQGMITRSRHSRRIEPTNHSTNGSAKATSQKHER